MLATLEAFEQIERRRGLLENRGSTDVTGLYGFEVELPKSRPFIFQR